MEAIQSVNLALRFLLELCALVALGYWGFHTGDSMAGKVALGIGSPLLAAVVWGLFVAPKATVTVPGPIHVLLQIMVFGSATAALAVSGHRVLALAFMLNVIVNAVLLHVWRQQGIAAN